MRLHFYDTENIQDLVRYEKIRRKQKLITYTENKFNSYVLSQVPGSVHGIEDAKVRLSINPEKVKKTKRPGIVIDHPDYHNHFLTTWVPLSSKTRRNTDRQYVFLRKAHDGIDKDSVVLLAFIRKYLCNTLVSFGQQIRNEKLEEVYTKLNRMGYEFGK